MMTHRNAHPAQRLNAFRNLVDEVTLLGVMFIKQQVKRVERRTGNLPMVLLVKRTESGRTPI